jgi:hypothetical protein
MVNINLCAFNLTEEIKHVWKMGRTSLLNRCYQLTLKPTIEEQENNNNNLMDYPIEETRR